MYVCSTSILYYSLVLAMFSVVIIYTSIYGILAFQLVRLSQSVSYGSQERLLWIRTGLMIQFSNYNCSVSNGVVINGIFVFCYMILLSFSLCYI